MEKIILKITGMHCQGCANTIAGRLKKIPGVKEASVNFASEEALISFEPPAPERSILESAVRELGYGIASEGDAGEDTAGAAAEKRDLILTWALTAALSGLMVYGMYFGGHSYYLACAEVLLAGIVVFYAGLGVLRKGFSSAFLLSPNMELLIALGALSAYATGIAHLLRQPVENYAGIGGMIIAFHLTGRFIESRMKRKASSALRKLIALGAKTANVERGGKVTEVRVQDLKVGDVMIIKPGEKIPTDGAVISGSSTVDESIATGESFPVEKSEGGQVIGGTLNQLGTLKVKASRIGKDTFLSNVIRLVREAQNSRVPVQELADRVTVFFVPAIILLALATAGFWIYAGRGASYAVFCGVAVLVIACPCALGLATPTALVVSSSLGANRGILIRDGASLQKLQSATRIAFDKTGTLTSGKLSVTSAVSAEGSSKRDLLALAAGVEKNSEHPVARAIIISAEQEGVTPQETEQFKALPGYGVEAVTGRRKVLAGKEALISEQGIDTSSMGDVLENLRIQGSTIVFVACDGKLTGVIAVSDTPKDDARNAVAELEGMGLRTVMLTGDNAVTAEAVAAQAGIREVMADLLPAGKTEAIKRMKENGEVVAMVGDGINDAPALAASDIGIALGSGTDIAIESAGIVLVRHELKGVADSVRLARATLRNIKQNLFWAFFYNLVAIPVAMSGFLHPLIAETAMAASSITVVCNSLRLKRMLK